MSDQDVVVIGGGFAGVAAAVELRARGLSVIILDDRPTLGGRARSDLLEGIWVDTGPQLIVSSFVRTLRLLGARPGSPGAPHGVPGLRASPGRDVLVRGAKRYAIQLGSIRNLLRFGGLSAGVKMRLGASMVPLLLRHRRALDAAATLVPAALDRESARTYVERTIGPDAAETLVETAVNAFYAARGEEISLAFYLMLGRYGSDSDVLAPIGGWSALLAQAAHGIAYETGVRIMSLESAAPGVVVARATDGREWRADGAVVATGPRAASALLAPCLGPAAPLRAWLDAVTVRPTWTLAVVISRTPDRQAFGILQHAAEAQVVAACAVHGAKLGADAPTTGDVVLAWPTPSAATRLHESPAATIVAAMMPELERLVPEARGAVTHARLYRAEAGTPIVPPGFAADRARGRLLAEQLSLPIALAGDYLATPTVEGAVASGEAAAGLLATRLRAS